MQDPLIAPELQQKQSLLEPDPKTDYNRMMSSLRRLLSQSPYYLSQALLIAVVLSIQLGLANRNLHVPFDYKADTVYEAAIVKSIIQEGWWWHVQGLSAPGGIDLVAVPILGNLDCGVIKILSVFTRDVGLLLNFYWFSTVLLAGGISTWCMLRLGINRWVAFVLGILYALSPHIYYRHTAHLTVTHHLIPLVGTSAVLLAMGRIELSREKAWRGLLAGCVLIGFSYIYWAFFSCFVLLIGGLVGFLRQRNIHVLRMTGLALGLVAVAASINLAPSIWTWKFDPTLRKFVTYKMPAEAEIYGLKIRQLLAPKSDSRLPFLAQVADKMKSANYPLENENSMSRMGFIPSLGFLLAICIAVFYIGPKRGPTLDFLKVVGTLIVACILLATIGGFGSIFNLLVSPDVRCYNRISIFIIFFSLIAIGIVFTKLCLRFPQNNWPSAALVAVLLLGISDQNEASVINAWKSQDESKFRVQSTFLQQVEKSLPKASMVYQLPQGQYGDDPRIKAVMWNANEEAYLLSNSIRWSWPAVSEEAITFGRLTEELNPPALADALYYRGYRGIYVDREGYADGASNLVSGLTGYLSEQPIQSSNGRYVFFPMLSAKAQNRRNFGGYVWGTPILFNAAGSAAQYQSEGWSCLGCTDGKNSTMNLRVLASSGDISIYAHLTPVLNTKVQVRPVRVYVDDVRIGEWFVRRPDWYSISVPRTILGQKTHLSIRFELPNAVAPLDLAANPDFHISGVHFEEMILAPKTLGVDLASYPAGANQAKQLPSALANSGFEDGNLSPWVSWLDPRPAINGRFFRGGTHCLAEAGPGSMYQDATGLEPGYTYKFAAWVSGSTDTSATGQISIWDPGTNVATSSAPVAVNRNWTLVSHTATASASGTLRIHLFHNTGTGIIFWDDISIYREQ